MFISSLFYHYCEVGMQTFLAREYEFDSLVERHSHTVFIIIVLSLLFYHHCFIIIVLSLLFYHYCFIIIVRSECKHSLPGKRVRLVSRTTFTKFLSSLFYHYCEVGMQAFLARENEFDSLVERHSLSFYHSIY